MDATPGLTRDRLYGDLDWRGVPFRIVDTGGLDFSSKNALLKAVASQVTRAMEEASVALLVCDGRVGVAPLDQQVAEWARRWSKPVVLVINKVDVPQEALGIYEFSALGVGSPFAISSLHGLGIGELLDRIVEELKRLAAGTHSEIQASGTSPIKVAIVGRPNVGKSSLMNRLLNEERVLVDSVPGTTRDPVEAAFTYKEQPYLLVDTAGVRSKSKVKRGPDLLSRFKAIHAIRDADVCLGVLDASAGVLLDDLKVLDEVVSAGKPLCLVLNKWDLLDSRVHEKEVTQALYRRAPFLSFAPVVGTSAKTGFQLLAALEQVTVVAVCAKKRISSGQCRKFLENLRTYPKAPVGIRQAHFIRLSQVAVSPPTFHLLMRVRRKFRNSDVAFLERLLRKQLKFIGTPIRFRLLTKMRQGRSRLGRGR